MNILTYPKNLEGSITVMGEHGTVRVGGVAMNTIQEWSFADTHPMDEEVPAASYDPKNVYGSGHLVYYQEVLEALGGKRSQTLTGREGRKTLRNDHFRQREGIRATPGNSRGPENQRLLRPSS